MKDLLLASGPLYFLIFAVLAMVGLFSFILKRIMSKQYKNMPVGNIVNEKEEAKRKAEKEKRKQAQIEAAETNETPVESE